MKNKAFKIIIAVLALALIGSLAWFAISDRPAADTGKPAVTTSIYPLYFLAERIGGERIELRNIVPAGSEPHDFEPTARDLAALADSDLVIINGGGLEAWSGSAEDVARGHLLIAAEDLAGSVIAGPDGSIADPHIWLDPSLVSRLAETIAARLAAIDPEGKEYYDARLASLREEFSRLDQDYRSGLADCGRRSFITSHAAFGYLAAAYNLEQLPIAGLEPDAEPSPRQLADLADLARRNDIHYIFFETMTSSELARTLAQEVEAATLVLNPLEGLTEEERSAGQDYLSEMRNNLNNLRLALECR